VTIDVVVFLWLFYNQYWKHAKRRPPQSFLDVLKDVTILMPAATVPWLLNQVYGLIIELSRWDVHIPYFLFWGILFLMGLIAKHFRFRKETKETEGDQHNRV